MLAPAVPQGQPVARERQFHRRTHGLYFHSSPPKAIKPSNIRIWLHHKQMSKLAKVLWAGQGMRLRTETSHHPKMKRFLECVPHVMGVIKDIHQAVIENDLDTLKEKTAPPAPRVILTSKDANGLTPLHKAAGLAHTQIVEYILSVWPSLSSVEDHTGKTPLHWAASAKNNARSFNLLVQAGADETALDDRHKPAEYYKNKPSDIDRSLLSVIPEAPRISQQGFPAYFDWGMFTLEEDSDEVSQTRMKPFLSQNNLLDADPASGAGSDHTSASVAKSKSVHNLTNGVLTELSAEPDKESINGKESPFNGTENGVHRDGKEADQKKSGENGEHEATPTPTTATEDETVVEPVEQHTLPEDGEANVPKGEESTNGDGGDDEQIVCAGTESVEQEEEVDVGEGEKIKDLTTTAEVADDGDSADERRASAHSNSTVKSSIAGSRPLSAREASANGRNGVEELDEDKDSSHHAETNDTSPEVVEEGEVSRDSLEQAPSAPKDDEIDQDSLGKDGEPEEAVAQNIVSPLEQEADTVSTRSLSAQSVKDSTMIAPSRAASSKSSKSTATGVELNDLARVSKPSSATSEQMQEKLPADQPRPDESHDGNALAHGGSSAKQRTAPSSANRERSGGHRSGRAETTKGSPTSAHFDSSSRLASAKDEEAGSLRLASSGTNSSAKASAKSTASVSANRRASVTSNKSRNSGKSPSGREQDVGHEADDDSDSNNTDVQIVSYRTQDETEEVSSESSVANGVATEPLQQQKLSETQQEARDPMETTEPQQIDPTQPGSPSQALEIEGRVQGEADNGQLQSQNQRLVREELEQRLNAEKSVQDAIATSDLEQLAVIVLEGKGKTLIGRTSEQSEIQAFLDNVPAYMGKIRRVHLAAREGNLRDLQSALDRRKFATAKDEVSPHGATPLHVATVFGHAGIVRYLAGRFPETLSATDDDGRTPLHYAATLKDNGHFYNLLTHLGANSKVEDNLNHSAEYYLGHVQSQGILSHRQLLRDYGAKEELAEEMLNDQEFGDQQVEIPLFRTEEGRYLATSLGDPLIKGLTEVANKRPPDPIIYLANYLYNFANQKAKTGSKELGQDTNNNLIEGTVKQAAEKEVESSVKRAPSPPTAMEPTVRDEKPPSPEDSDENVGPSDDRDEHGQSMLHFACARSHGRNALIQLIDESGINITYRDELYRTARDVALQATQPDNAKEIDRYVIALAAKGDLETLNGMLLDGYDHIVDVVASDGIPILEVAKSRGHQDVVRFFETARTFEENRENLLGAIREKNLENVVKLTKGPDGAKLVRAKNYYGRNALHIAILMENEDIVDYLASNFSAALKIGDNLQRTPLHYAMGVSSVEAISRILIKNGAKRVVKDLKGRQPSYYFMNKADILRLQEEEKE